MELNKPRLVSLKGLETWKSRKMDSAMPAFPLRIVVSGALQITRKTVRWRRLQMRLVEENPHEASYRDTHAYVLYRGGHLDQAIEQERIALVGAASDPLSGKLYTMFFRFLAERGRSNLFTIVRHDGGDVVVDCAIPGAVIFAGHPEQGLARGCQRGPCCRTAWSQRRGAAGVAR